MEYKNILDISNRRDFRRWLECNAETESECWIAVKRGEPVDETVFYYLDAVEEALCFGWIDSTNREINDKRYQRFSPRTKNSNWTELNKERVRRLEKLGLMTDAGRKVLPPMGKKSFQMDSEIVRLLKENRAWLKFKSFPPLYQRVRVSNLLFYRKRDKMAYQRTLDRFIAETKQGKMFGEWNDYGRLLNI